MLGMKKFLLLAAPLLLVSCAGTPVDSSIPDSQENDDRGIIRNDTEITFLCMADSSYYGKLQDMVHRFELEEPHVKVNLANPQGSGKVASIERIVVTGFFKEDYPDIVQCYPDNVINYLYFDKVMDMRPFLSNEGYGLSEQERADYIESFMLEGAQYAVEGQYSLPFCKSTEAMYYNADVLLGLNLSGVDPSINNGQPLDATYLDSLTWEELLNKLCPAIIAYNEATEEKIIKPDTLGKYSVVTYDSDQNFFITLANQYGYEYTSVDDEGHGHIGFNNAGMRDLMHTMWDAKDKHYLETSGTYETYVSNLFQKQGALFTISSTAGLTYNYNFDEPFRIGVASIPHAEGKEEKNINQGLSVCFLDHEDNDRSLASFLLWKYITNVQNSSDWAIHTGYMGIRNSSYETDEYRAAITPPEDLSSFEAAKASNMQKIADIRGSTFNTAVFNGSSNARTAVGELIVKCLNSDGSDEAISSLFAQYEAEANEYVTE